MLNIIFVLIFQVAQHLQNCRITDKCDIMLNYNRVFLHKYLAFLIHLNPYLENKQPWHMMNI